MKAAGVRFVYIKATQGTTHKDPRFAANMAGAKSAGLLRAPYHFTTTDDAAKQFALFTQVIESYDFELPPAMDCEYYNSYTGEPILGYRLEVPPLTAELSKAAFGAIPTEAIVDSLGRKLSAWMKTIPAMAGYPYPVIYTNQASGNAIFKTASMSRYPLWVASWHGPTVPLTEPRLPKIWAGKPWYVWQDGIVDGPPYGIPDADVDHDLWGGLYPFPGEPLPPPPAKRTIELVGKGKSGEDWTGKMEVI
jgi:lysozyme